MMNYTFLSATILLVLITDPVGNIPIFANALKHVPQARRPYVILREILIAFALLLTFMFVGEGFLHVMNLSDRLADVKCPVLLVRTEGQGQLETAGHEVLEKGLPNARTEWLHSTGLHPYLTHPHRLAKILKGLKPE